MEITEISVPNYEKVIRVEDKASGLKAFISVYSTRLGPSLGGTRMWPYKTEDAALQDVLLLSKAMAYKSSASGIPLGGGKGVIWGNPKTDKSPDLFRAYGKAVESLQGKYITTEDSGISVADLEIMAEETNHVTGLSHGSGNPSPATAIGVFYGIKAAVKHRLGKDNVEGLRVLVQGVGQVGGYLLSHLKEAGCKITVADIDDERLNIAAAKFGCDVVSPEEIFKVKCDVFAPCALGQAIRPDDINSYQFSIVSGGANNQLLDEMTTAPLLQAKGILHSPDYVINAGGIINIYVIDILKNHDVEGWLKKIPVSLSAIFERSQKENQPPLFIAHKIAEERMEKGSVE